MRHRRVLEGGLWRSVFGSATAVARRIAVSSTSVAADFLEHDAGISVGDRWAQIGHAETHAVFLAHLLRDARYAIDAG